MGRDVDCIAIQYLLGMGFRRAATSYCCSIGLAPFPVLQITWVYLDSSAPTHTRRLQPEPNHQPRISSFLAQDGLNCLHLKAGPDLCYSSAEPVGLPFPPSSAQPPLEQWSALLPGAEHKEAAQTVVLKKSFCLSSGGAGKYNLAAASAPSCRCFRAILCCPR